MPTPEPDAGEVRLRVAATALDRADLMQMRGQYPPPLGASWQEGALQPRIHQIYPFNEVARAYHDMQRGGVLGNWY